MSKTDNTRPFWVQVQDWSLPGRPWHNCHMGPCDYEPHATFASEREYGERRCARLPYHTGGEYPLSKFDPAGRKAQTRHHRQQVRALLRLAEQLHGDYDLLMPPYTRRDSGKYPMA